MTIAVDLGRKATKQTNKLIGVCALIRSNTVIITIYILLAVECMDSLLLVFFFPNHLLFLGRKVSDTWKNKHRNNMLLKCKYTANVIKF